MVYPYAQKIVVGTCSCCGGPVSVIVVSHSSEKAPVPICDSCGAVARWNHGPHGSTIQTVQDSTGFNDTEKLLLE